MSWGGGESSICGFIAVPFRLGIPPVRRMMGCATTGCRSVFVLGDGERDDRIVWNRSLAAGKVLAFRRGTD
jgi:hypothetical protein